ncbi:MAG: hypothetical protein ACLRL6_16645 [Clostridium sp.]
MKTYSFTKKPLIETYGCAYSKRDLLLTIGGACLCVWAICYMQRLQLLYTCVVIATLMLLLPAVISSYFIYQSEKNALRNTVITLKECACISRYSES